MEKKFSIVISPTTDAYAVVLRCYTVNDEGEQVTVAQEVTSVADITDAVGLTKAFIQANK